MATHNVAPHPGPFCPTDRLANTQGPPPDDQYCDHCRLCGQRFKLAMELSRVDTGKTLYILDEPMTGLHFEDIKKLLAVRERLVKLGNTVIVIEHNLDVMKTADWIIDLGPKGGESGGHQVAWGTPEQIAAIDDNHTGRLLRTVLGGAKTQA